MSRKNDIGLLLGSEYYQKNFQHFIQQAQIV